MKIKHTFINENNKELILFVLTNGEQELEKYSELNASIVKCHIDSDGHNVTQDELYNEQVVGHLMQGFVSIIKEYEAKFPSAKKVVIGSNNNAEVALDLLIKENELIDGGVLIKPLLNIALSEGIMIEDNTKVLIIKGTREDSEKQIQEQEVADILSVNGYDVNIIEIDEDETLSDQDVKVAKNWIKENFNN
jgi:predicted esterase